MQRFGIGTGGISGQDLVRVLAISGTNGTLIRGSSDGRDEKRALVGIGPDQDVGVVVVSRFVKLVLITQEHVAVENGPRAAQAGRRTFQDGLGGFGSRIGYRRRTELGKESDAVLLGGGERIHVLATFLGLALWREVSAAL